MDFKGGCRKAGHVVLRMLWFARDQDFEAPFTWFPPEWRRIGYGALAVGLAALTVLDTGPPDAGLAGYWAPRIALQVLHVVPVFLSRRRPMTASRLVFLSLVVDFWLPDHSLPSLAMLTFIPVIAFAMARATGPDAGGILVFSVAALAFSAIGSGTSTPFLAGPLPIATAIVLIINGRPIGNARRAKLAAATEQTRRIVLEERARIARELHDIVAHHLSLIAVRAESAEYRLSTVDGQMRAELDEIKAAARQALAETRDLVGLLRREDGEAELAPQPGLDDLAELVDGVGAYRTSGVRHTVPASVSLAVYRITQEALSNARQHSPGARIQVSLDFTADRLSLEVRNGPATVRTASATGGGHGMIGMRERVKLVNGSLRAGPTADGGYVVSVEVPA